MNKFLRDSKDWKAKCLLKIWADIDFKMWLYLTFFVLQYIDMLRMHHNTPVTSILPETKKRKKHLWMLYVTLNAYIVFLV